MTATFFDIISKTVAKKECFKNKGNSLFRDFSNYGDVYMSYFLFFGVKTVLILFELTFSCEIERKLKLMIISFILHSFSPLCGSFQLKGVRCKNNLGNLGKNSYF